MKALHDLVQSGKVLYIGVSNMRLAELAEMQMIAVKNNWTKTAAWQRENRVRDGADDASFAAHE